MARKKSRVKNAARAARLKAMWDDPTKGDDGLTYRERMQKRAKDQRERELAAVKKGGDAPSSTPAANAPDAPEAQKVDPPASSSGHHPKAKRRSRPAPTPATPPTRTGRTWGSVRFWG